MDIGNSLIIRKYTNVLMSPPLTLHYGLKEYIYIGRIQVQYQPVMDSIPSSFGWYLNHQIVMFLMQRLVKSLELQTVTKPYEYFVLNVPLMARLELYMENVLILFHFVIREFIFTVTGVVLSSIRWCQLSLISS